MCAKPLPDLRERVAQAMADYENEHRYELDNGYQSTGVEPYEFGACDFEKVAAFVAERLALAPVPGEGQDARETGAQMYAWKCTRCEFVTTSKVESDTHAVWTHDGWTAQQRIEVVPASERDRLQAEVEQWKRDYDDALRITRRERAGEVEQLREALMSARALVGVVHQIDGTKGRWSDDDEPYWVLDDVHVEDCSACALERTIDAALDRSLESDEKENDGGR